MFDQFEGKRQKKDIYYSHKSGFDPPIWPPINHLHISLPAQIVQIKWKNLSIAEGKNIYSNNAIMTNEDVFSPAA